MRASLTCPIVVVAAEEPNRHLVIDGHEQIAALDRLGRDAVEAVVCLIGEAEALQLALAAPVGTGAPLPARRTKRFS